MTKLATMGTSSCATIALQGFNGMDINIKYVESGVELDDSVFKDVNDFYHNILYPTQQDLGRTKSHPFEALMQAIDKSQMNDKFTIATLAEYQATLNDRYWLKQLEKWGFILIDKTKNSIGEMCYIYVRNLARPGDFEIATR